MHITALTTSKQPGYWSKALHLFYAGLYAFVLPLICWGAQATPGHPHAHAHFVFVEPELSAHRVIEGALDHPTDHSTHAAAAHGPHEAQGDQAAECYHHPHAAPVDEPRSAAGRSVPMQLVISGLMLIGAVPFMAPLHENGAGFSVWLAASSAAPFLAPVPTPPPR